MNTETQKTEKALAALDTMATIWAAKIDLSGTVQIMLDVPAEHRKKKLIEFIKQAHVEGLFDGFHAGKSLQAHAAFSAPAGTDANNYCRILSALGMEEEGDPVAEVQRLVANDSALAALAAMTAERDAAKSSHAHNLALTDQLLAERNEARMERDNLAAQVEALRKDAALLDAMDREKIEVSQNRAGGWTAINQSDLAGINSPARAQTAREALAKAVKP